MTHPAAQSGSIQTLAEEFLARYRRGERPAVAEYTSRYPELAHEIRDLFPALMLREEGGSPDPTVPQVAHAAAPDTPLPRRLGDYHILRELGRGGMGVVYEAEQQTLGRRVALKVLPAALADDPTCLERFRREARSAARLHHSNIVPVFDVGQAAGLHYYAMQLIDGHGLDAVLRELRQNGVARPVDPSAPTAPLPASGASPATGSLGLSAHANPDYFRGVARLARQAAEALAYAHEQGVLHRDVKPANLLLDAHGTLWVTDFGLAKDGGDDLTRTGDVVGTLRYIAPERLSGQSDARSDIYSLGATLYELLTLQSAFDGPDRARMVRQILHGDPKPPRRIDPRVPADLETICLKAMAREPGRRYASAAALADDLGRFLADLPIRARRTSALGHAWRWCRRNPVLALALIALWVSVLLGTVFYRHKADVAEENEKLAQEHERDAKNSLAEANRQRYISDLLAVQAAWERGLVGRVNDLLDRQLPEKNQGQDLRGFEWYYWHRQVHSDLLTLRGHTGPVWAVAYRPDGRQIASAGEDGTVRLWSADGTPLRTLGGDGGPVYTLAYSPDGKLLASGGMDALIHLWDADEGNEVAVLRGHTERIHCLTFRRDGRRLISGSNDGTARTWDLATRQEIFKKHHGDPITGAAYSPDGKTLAATGMAGVLAWDADTGEESPKCKGFFGGAGGQLDPHEPTGAAFHPGGGWLVWWGSWTVSFKGNGLSRWDMVKGQEVNGPAPCEGLGISAAAFSNDGRAVVTGDDDGRVSFWETVPKKPDAKLAYQFKGHTGRVNGVAFAPDGRRAVSASTDGTVKVWDAVGGRQPIWLRGHANSPHRLVFSADSRRLVSYAQDYTVRTWDAEKGVELSRFDFPKIGWDATILSPDGRYYAVAMRDGTVTVHATDDGRVAATFRPEPRFTGWPIFSPDGRYLADPVPGGRIIVWDWANARAVFTITTGHPDIAYGLAFSPDSRRIAWLGSGEAKVGLCDLAGDEPKPTFRDLGSSAYSVAFSPDGRLLAAPRRDRSVEVWEVGGPNVVTLRGHAGRLLSASFSADSRRLATCADDGTVKVWELVGGQELLSIRQRAGEVVFSHDGLRLAATARGDGFSFHPDHLAVIVWDARPNP